MTTTDTFHTQDAGALWATRDLSRFIGCSERQIARLREEGLPFVRVGGLNRPDDAFVNGQTGEVVSIGMTTVVVSTEGSEIEVAPYRWRYDSNDAGTAWFEQLPLRLDDLESLSEGLAVASVGTPRSGEAVVTGVNQDASTSGIRIVVPPFSR